MAKLNGIVLLKDTASLTNAIMNNGSHTQTIKVFDGVCHLMWTDRVLYQVRKILDGDRIVIRRVKTHMKNWLDGIEYPDLSPDGSWVCDDTDIILKRFRNKWYCCDKNGKRLCGADNVMYLSFGCTTGYCDPSF